MALPLSDGSAAPLSAWQASEVGLFYDLGPLAAFATTQRQVRLVGLRVVVEHHTETGTGEQGQISPVGPRAHGLVVVEVVVYDLMGPLANFATTHRDRLVRLVGVRVVVESHTETCTGRARLDQ